ncbi:hypothetical protein [Legionella londiniensis]|uniref:Uncharacterized protein n=1 Tax=Legionella londiniensis TaxID=45068 RepID=A0A0W0VT59_9GAMM|nr:hypothetical protein [Legionella londiniensis]KTD23247.1 hypothetical protein Llon_0132 [Legionella londiniensis]STX93741.1 Uncharacterised protein [Legionella londiniensis]
MPANSFSIYKPDEVENVIVGTDFFSLIEAINIGEDAGEQKPKTLLIRNYLEKDETLLAEPFIEKLLEGYEDKENSQVQNILSKKPLTKSDLTKLLQYDSFIDHIFKNCKDKNVATEVKQNKAAKTWDDLLAFLIKTARFHGAVIDPLYNISNVENDIQKKYKQVKNIVNPLKISEAPKNEEVETVIVGAGPIGLLNAIGLLHNKPDMKLVILEKYDEYKRNHTLMVDYRQIEKFLKVSSNPNPDPAIAELVRRTKKNKYIRISEIEHLLKNRAVELGAHLITGHGVADVQKEIFETYPNAGLIIGADGTRSVVSQQAMGNISQYQVVAGQGDDEELQENAIHVSRGNDGKIQYSMKTIDGKEVRNIATDIDAPQTLGEQDIEPLKKDIQTAAARNYHAGNTVKREFDFVLQFRFEIEGEAPAIPLPTLVRFMQNYGLTCDEYVGKTDAQGKTPITFQMMISKEHYQILEKFAKSGNPVKPFSGTDEERMAQVPEILMQQLKGYLGLRLRHFTGEDDIVALDKATISVNEAPATFAKEVYKKVNDRRVLLLGDAGLGLSYFKGINAGFEASAKAFPHLLKDAKESDTGLKDEYKDWFENTYAPQKVNEVRDYSVFRIGLLVRFFKTLQFIFRSDLLMRGETAEKTVDLYLGHLKAVRAEQDKMVTFIPKKRPSFAQLWYNFKAKVKDVSPYTLASVSSASESLESFSSEMEEPPVPKLPKWTHAYEHNGKRLESVLTFRPKDSWIILREIGKNIKEGVKPYKSWFYVLRDLAAPLRALYNLLAGITLILTALPIELFKGVYGLLFPAQNETRLSNLGISVVSFFSRLLEGVSRLVLAVSLAVSTVFLPFKLGARGISTLAHHLKEPLIIENNHRIKTLVHDGEEILPKVEEVNRQNEELDQTSGIEALNNTSVNANKKPLEVKKLSSIALELHTQYEKYASRHQATNVSKEDEKKAYKECVSKGDAESYHRYFGLFKPKAPVKAQEEIKLDNLKLQ